MKPAALLLLIPAALAGCSTATGAATPGLEPIPGSITYGGQPRTKLMKSPIGSIVPNRFIDSMGRNVEETYILQPDRSLKLVSRHYRPFFGLDDD